MNVIKSNIPDILIIEPDVFGDHRGYFMETYSFDKYARYGIDNIFVQDNMSYSAHKGTIRGLHFQNDPMAQAKLITCRRGKVLDIAVDIRKGSPTYKKWVAIELSAENKKQIFIPRGFAHGFVTLTDDVEFTYKVDNFYSKEHERGIRYDDTEIGIHWEELLQGLEAILSDKDANSPSLKESDCNFVYRVEKR